MDLIKTEDIFDVHQRVAGHYQGQTYWRVSMTINAPVAIDHKTTIGLAMQLGLTEAEVAAVIGTDAFPAQLNTPGQTPRALNYAQWPYKPVVAALLALVSAKS